MPRSWFVALAALSACARSPVPTHNGYASKRAAPWQEPIVLVLDASGEAEADEVISYPRRQRARWYAIDLPAGGELEIDLSVTAISDGEVDLAFEVLDDGFRPLVRADGSEDDAGDEEKRRTLAELVPGRYYIHVYAQHRVDEADFTLAVSHRGSSAASASGFPRTIAFVGQLPAVPSEDDAPAPPPVRPPPCRGKGCEPDRPAPSRAVRARIAGITTKGSGTVVKIDRGADDGVAVGWRGAVVTREGKPIASGGFEIERVTARESFATVAASAEAVTAAKYVTLRPR